MAFLGNPDRGNTNDSITSVAQNIQNRQEKFSIQQILVLYFFTDGVERGNGINGENRTYKEINDPNEVQASDQQNVTNPAERTQCRQDQENTKFLVKHTMHIFDFFLHLHIGTADGRKARIGFDNF